MRCIHCGNEFESKRSSAKYCSDKCKMANHRVSVTEITVTKDSVTDSVTNTAESPKKRINSITDKPSFLCKTKGCFLEFPPGHDNLCIYHWRIKEGLPHISKEQYDKLNQEMSDTLCLKV